MKNKLSHISLLILIIALISACSADKKTFTARTYHNITAHYNAYFIANQDILAVQKALKENYKDNFEKTLRIFPTVDSAVIKSNADKLKHCIEKASIGINRHKNSKWVDDCYYLVGMARYYRAEFQKAIETFKYINVKSKDDPTRHEALISLEKTFTDHGEIKNAMAVSDYLKREDLNDDNKLQFYLTNAYLHQVREDPGNVVANLLKAMPLMKKGPEKARYYFIIGQIYQKLGFDAEAYHHYNSCLNNKPSYDVSFFARLNLARVTELNKTDDVRKIRRFFSKMLKDGKNKEFRDKIYYEMALFEQKQQNYDEALRDFRKSINLSEQHPRQKAYAYWKTGQLYYENLRKYNDAKVYYDSAVAVMPQDEDVLPQLQERKKILTAFVTQLNIIETQDSLLQLAHMDTIQLDSIYEAKVAAEKAALEANKKKRKGIFSVGGASTVQDQKASASIGPNTQGGTWYFYNSSAISAGESDFVQKWGERPLEDHWRRSEKDKVVAANNQNTVASEGENLPQETTDSAAVTASAPPTADQQKAAFFSQIPFSKEAQQEANKKIDDALFNLGNIYYLQLKEVGQSALTFEKLLGRYPETEHKPEALYQLYLIYKDSIQDKADRFAKMLVKEFPNSIYAKLTQNPNYREESKAAEEKVKKLYAQAYAYYKQDSMVHASKILNHAIQDYTENDFTDNLVLLKALITGKTDGLSNYKYALTKFMETYPKSDMKDYAQKLLDGIDSYQKKERERQGVHYTVYFDQPHYFVLLYQSNKALSDILPAQIDQFIHNAAKNESLKSGNLIFNKEYAMILVSEFPGKSSAMDFYKKFNNPQLSPLKGFRELKFDNFVISKENFQVFYEAKDREGYLSFFKKNYAQYNGQEN